MDAVLPRRLRSLTCDVRRVSVSGGPSMGIAIAGNTSPPADGRGGSAKVSDVCFGSSGVSSRGAETETAGLGAAVSWVVCRWGRGGNKNARCAEGEGESAVLEGPGVTRSSSHWRFPTTACGSYSTASGNASWPSTSTSSSITLPLS